jgi:hypothetical protein
VQCTCDLVPLDVLEDALVGGRLAALVVLGLQTVDRHDDLEAAQADPFLGNRPHGARDHLRVHAALGELREGSG